MQSRLLFIALSATLFGAPVTAAQDKGQENGEEKFFADLSYSQLGNDYLVGDSAYDPDYEFSGISGHLGYRFSEHWSVEGEAMVGVENHKRQFRTIGLTESLTTSTTTDLGQLLGVYIKGTLPITKKLKASTCVGVTYSEFDKTSQAVRTNLATNETTTETNNWTDYEAGVALGVGLVYDVADRIYLRGDFTKYDHIDIELDSISVGVGVRF